jgi:hypothetical protein
MKQHVAPSAEKAPGIAVIVDLAAVIMQADPLGCPPWAAMATPRAARHRHRAIYDSNFPWSSLHLVPPMLKDVVSSYPYKKSDLNRQAMIMDIG